MFAYMSVGWEGTSFLSSIWITPLFVICMRQLDGYALKLHALFPSQNYTCRQFLLYKLHKILDSKYNLHCWSTCELFHYIQWMGYEDTNKEFQWTAATNLMHADQFIEGFFYF